VPANEAGPQPSGPRPGRGRPGRGQGRGRGRSGAKAGPGRGGGRAGPGPRSEARMPAVAAAVPGLSRVGPGRRSRHACHATPPPSRHPECFVRLSWRIGLVRSIGATGWAFQNKVCLRRVRGPRCGLVAPCGSGQPAAMRCAPFAASCPRGYRVDGAIVLVLCGTTAHRPASGGRDPVRKTADLAYNGRNSPARRELKLFRDVYHGCPDTPYEPDPPRQPDKALRIA
jgi:hypothetical protein